MARSLKKGPFVDDHLLTEGGLGAGDQGQEADQDLVAPFDDPARFRRPDHRRAQRQAARTGVCHREHGRPQARRVCADPHVQRPRGRQEDVVPHRRSNKETDDGNHSIGIAASACRRRKAGWLPTRCAACRSTRRSTFWPSRRRRPPGIIKKVLESAIANAEHNDGADIDELSVTSIYVEQGRDAAPLLRRAQRAAALAITKQTCHIYRHGRRRQGDK